MWDKLSMKEKAAFIRTAVRNGIYDRADIVDRYNKFAMGGDIEETRSKPTLDEYYAKRAAEEQNLYYLQGSRNRKESYPLYYQQPYTKEDEARDRKNVNQYIETLHRNTGMPVAEIYNRLGNRTLYGAEQLHGNDASNIRVDMLTRAANRLTTGKHIPSPLANCIATATSNNPNKGHFVTGNLTFAANPRKFGFMKVDKSEAKPGSLVQVVGGNIPTHAMILNSNNDGVETFNYSPGSYPQYKTNVRYPVGERYGTHLDYYNFVGNEADSARWKKEYEERYNKKDLGEHIYGSTILNM